MKRKWLEMRYNKDCGYWYVVDDGQTTFLFEGEWFDLRISEERSYLCRLQYAKQWILIMGDMLLNLRKQEVYKVEI